jgi:predicted glycogen debranching enzyme
MVVPLPLFLGTETVSRLDAGGSREWLVADGCGGYAAGTVSGLRTRRYHGLLVVADGSPAVRHLGLVSLDPVVVLPGGSEVPLAVHEWSSGAVAPRGHTLLQHVDLDDGLPRWQWRIGDLVIEREVAMQHGRPSVAVVHRVRSGGPIALRLQAVVTWRDVHGERGRWGPDPTVESTADGAVVDRAYRLRGPGWSPAGTWWEGAHARHEKARGLAADEDLYLAGTFEATLSAGEVLEVSGWADLLEQAPPPATEVVRGARRRASRLADSSGASDGPAARLVLAADSFVTTGPDVVAGYPWFGAWSRDTMTSYEGIFLETGRLDEGRRLLEAYAASLSEGMLANTADTGRTEYNTADATLWFVHAVDRHVARTGDADLGALLLPHLDEIVEAHVAGTRYGIRVDADGLLTQGEPGQALTWMDARVDGTGVTPRIGKAVEVNALWLHGLAAVGRRRRAVGADDSSLVILEEAGRASFRRRFPAPGGGLRDVVDGAGGEDSAVRPNQLLAASLPDAVVAPEVVLPAVAPLLTPLGLRSLSPVDRAYRGRHRGGPGERDSGYHQGTVWPWLLGAWVDVAIAAGLPARGALDALPAHLAEDGLGSVAETLDGDPPHGSSGCPFQAWSVAELLRAWHRTES